MTVNKELYNLIEYYHENKISHAYLIVTNNIEKCMSDLLCVLKNIYCQSTYKDDCEVCNICNLINKSIFPNIKIIEPDKTKIKKEQILELKHHFSMTSQFAELNTYIIKNAEKMNKESTNSMLKFLEEPEKNVLGFFITNEKNNILDTIISRCEVLNIYYQTEEINEELGINQDKYNEIIAFLKEYLIGIESENNKSILINKLTSTFSERNDIINLMKVIFRIYNNALKVKISNEKKQFMDFDYIYNDSINKLIKKNNIILELITELNYNVNLELLLDRFVIEIGEVNNENIWSVI